MLPEMGFHASSKLIVFSYSKNQTKIISRRIPRASHGVLFCVKIGSVSIRRTGGTGPTACLPKRFQLVSPPTAAGLNSANEKTRIENHAIGFTSV
jgi:hypothetical protein